MYAVILDGGHQYRVEQGQRLQVELRPTEAGSTLVFDSVCLVAGEGSSQVGSPFVAGARVEAKVLKPLVKGKKVNGHTFRRRKSTHRRWGHRQQYTEIEITSISA
jgi:large subunit ribosomal protein L21